MTQASSSRHPWTGRGSVSSPPTRRPWLELSLVLVVILYYEAGNALFEADRDDAIVNAREIQSMQERLGLDVEGVVQSFFEPFPLLIQLLVFFYAGPHFLLTYGFLFWTYFKRPHSFPHVRNAFLLFTLTVFAFQWAFPVAPPRMVPELALHDSVTNTLPINGETPVISFLVNDYAAVPSVHTGWALLIAFLAIRFAATPWRWLWLLYPGVIVLSILATANHFVWDIVTAVAWLTMTELLHYGLIAWGKLPHHAPTPLRVPTPILASEVEP